MNTSSFNRYFSLKVSEMMTLCFTMLTSSHLEYSMATEQIYAISWLLSQVKIWWLNCKLSKVMLIRPTYSWRIIVRKAYRTQHMTIARLLVNGPTSTVLSSVGFRFLTPNTPWDHTSLTRHSGLITAKESFHLLFLLLISPRLMLIMEGLTSMLPIYTSLMQLKIRGNMLVCSS